MRHSVRAADSATSLFAFGGVGAVIWLEIPKAYHEAQAIVLFLVGVASFMFHATGTKNAQAFDRIGMYAVLSVLFWAAVARHEPEQEMIGVYIAMTLTWLVLAGLNWEIDSHAWIPGGALITSAIILVFGTQSLAIVALCLFIAGVFVDNWKPYGHSVRHVLFALAVLAAFAGI